MAIRGRQATAAVAGLLLAAAVQAQQQALPPPAAPLAEPPPVAAAQDSVTTLGEVRALKPEDDQPLDLYRYKSPLKVESNRFSRAWSEPPTPEQVSMSGGYLMMGIAYGIVKAGQGLNKITGGPDQIQAAIARPPPELSADQQRRAQQFCDPPQDCAAVPQR